jgi:hypothetical protein
MCVDVLDAWEYAICDVCVGADVSDAWECTPHSICVHDSDSLQVKRQYARGRLRRVGILFCTRCDVCVGADVSDAWEYFPAPDVMCVGADVSDAWECTPHSPYVYKTQTHYKCKGSMRVGIHSHSPTEVYVYMT